MGKKKEEAERLARELKLEQRRQQLILRETEYREIAGINDPESVEDRVKHILEGHETTQANEVERKWRVNALPSALVSQINEAGSYLRIRQGYTANGVRLREAVEFVRDEGSGEMCQGATRYYVSYKTHLDKDGVERYEPETELTDKEGIERFNRYWNERVGSACVYKTRYSLADGQGNDIELDIYDTARFSDAARIAYGHSLVIAEIEFPGLAATQANLYAFPPSLGSMDFTHVTPNSLFDNKTIANINGGRLGPDGKPPKPAGTSSGNGRRQS